MYSKFPIIIFLLILLSGILPGCNTYVESTPQLYEVGAVGQIVIQKEKIPIQFNSDTKVEVFPGFDFSNKITQDAIVLFPTEDLQVGEKLDIKINSQEEEFVFEAVVREPCVTYLADVTIAPEIWQLCGQELSKLTVTSGRVVDYAVAKNGDWIVYAVGNDDGETDIWKMGRTGENKEIVYSCGEMVCEQLAINSLGSKISFKSGGLDGSLFLLTIENGEAILVEDGNISNVDFSPNDELLRYFEGTKGYIRILSVDDLKIIKTLESDSDLIGSWKKDSSGFLFGQHNYWGGIAGIDLLEIDLLEDFESIVMNGAESSYYVYQPTFINNDEFLVLVRLGFNGNRKQIWEINRNGKVIKEITNDYQFNHSLISWNPVEEKLSFQRFEPSSSSALPEVWIWKKIENNFQMIGKNATHPEWVY
jgi:WD40 repeat protein